MSKRSTWVWLLATLVALSGVGCEGRSVYSGKLVLGDTHIFAPGDEVDGDLAMTGGSVLLHEGSAVSGSVYMLGGNLEIGGEVAGDVTMLSGTLVVRETARVEGELRIGGIDADVSPRAQIAGGVQSLPLIGDPSLNQAPSAVSRLLRAIASTIAVTLIAYVWVLLMPRPVRRVSTAITRHPSVTVATGLLVGVIALMLLVLMAYTIILIPVALFGLALLGVMALYGWIALAFSAGRYITGRRRRAFSPAVTAAIGMLLVMTVFSILELVPYLYEAVLGIGVLAGFGAVYLTRLGIWPYTPETVE